MSHTEQVGGFVAGLLDIRLARRARKYHAGQLTRGVTRGNLSGALAELFGAGIEELPA